MDGKRGRARANSHVLTVGAIAAVIILAAIFLVLSKGAQPSNHTTTAPSTTSIPVTVYPRANVTPAIYLGFANPSNALGGGETLVANQTVTYYPITISRPNGAYLSGAWYDAPDSVVSFNGSRIYLIYTAKSVNMEASGNGNQSTITVKLDGKGLNQSYRGADVTLVNGTSAATMGSSRLYNLVSASSYGTHLIEIDANQSLRIYAFTFG